MFSQRYAFVYVNIMKYLDDAVLSQKHHQPVLIYFWFMIYRLLSDPTQITPPQIIENRVKMKC